MLFHMLLCSFCSFTALFPNDIVFRLISLHLFQGVTFLCRQERCLSYLGKALFATQDCISFFLRLSLLVKDCQNPRDPLQPASKKKSNLNTLFDKATA